MSGAVPTCAICGRAKLDQFYVCDRAAGEWCANCFTETPCGQGAHGEGCPTLVFDDAFSDPDALECDQDGLTAEDWAAIEAAQREYEKRQRGRALKALWATPVVAKVRYDGVTLYRDSRDEDWSFLRAIAATIGIALRRYWGERQEERYRARTGRLFCHSLSLAYWDSLPVYGGWRVDQLQLMPGCRISIFHESESETGW